MKHRSKYRCECCDKDVKTGAIVCSDCLKQFYWIHSLFMAGLKQTQEQDK